jgi:hypothetical protein
MAEVLHHMQFAHVRSRKFAHSPETQHVTANLGGYLESASGPGHAFIVHGASGSGKTAHPLRRPVLRISSTASADRFTHAQHLIKTQKMPPRFHPAMTSKNSRSTLKMP